MRIYAASKVKHAPMWRELRAMGWPIISTWIDEAGEGESGDLSDLAHRCIAEASSADVLLLYCEPGEVQKGAMIEVGAALACGRRVISVGECDTTSKTFIHHARWLQSQTISDALPLAWACREDRSAVSPPTPDPH